MSEKFAQFKQTKDFFVGLDSDGCVFDTMELKWKECFVPMAIKHFGLQSVSKYARVAIEFVNLYSKDRGINRWPGIVNAVDWLRQWPEAMLREPKLPDFPRMRRWLKETSVHSNATLKALIEAEPDCEELKQWLAWSLAVNAAVKEMVHDVPPFPDVRASLEKITSKADLVVVSGTPCEALEREWEDVGLRPFAQLILGQEQGKKADHLRGCAVGKYPAERILMIGDAPGDRKAAEAVGACFYPIIPGEEEESWSRLNGEALGLFFAGRYAGDYEGHLKDHFEDSLPEQPEWVGGCGGGCGDCGCGCG